jgi:hypothetical protein
LQGRTILLWGLRTGWNFSQDCGFELNVSKNNEKIKIKRQWLRLWRPSEIHEAFRGFPCPIPMYRLNPPLIYPAFYHPRFCKSSSLSFYGYNIMCSVKHASSKLLLRCHLVYWDVWKLVIVRLWRMTGYLPWDWCIFTEILKWTCTKQWRCLYLLRHEGQNFDNLKIFLSIKVIKIVLDSMLYETLKWPQIAPFCISSKVIMACRLLSLNYRMSLYISRGSMKGEYTFYYDTFEFDECLLQISTKHWIHIFIYLMWSWKREGAVLLIHIIGFPMSIYNDN